MPKKLSVARLGTGGRIGILGGAALVALTTAAAPTAAEPVTGGAAWLHADGSAIRDSSGRQVLLHGVNVVAKTAPYYVSADGPLTFGPGDADAIDAAGFNVVRLGLQWKGLEPGKLPPNSPQVCGVGQVEDPGQYDPEVVSAYLDRIADTVDMLAQRHIYTLLDMHQDFFSERFGGDGAPDWALCTDGDPIVTTPSKFGEVLPATLATTGHFWRNDVRGGLQQEFQRVWRAVASRFADDPWVLGYDPFNEPTILAAGDTSMDTLTQCFYAGTRDPGRAADGRDLSCPATVPEDGVLQAIRSVDAHHMLLPEPAILGGGPLGPMPVSNTVVNFHNYCLLSVATRNLMGGNGFSNGCRAPEQEAMDRAAVASNGQPLLVTEFGAEDDRSDLTTVADLADQYLTGWVYWDWTTYGAGGDQAATQPLQDDLALRPKARALVRAYPTNVAGTLTALHFDPDTRVMTMTYLASSPAPTVIAAPALAYPEGFCATSSEGHTQTTTDQVTVIALDGQDPTVTIKPGRCTA
ncbi:cellulase family glycosylhydrolase [Nocardia sp. NEAU-G5]|uniref:Cellulase family glycosylhydrolase n=1 Tax=Nocardia albiluteola TaxID=2842303 RepID=A0ABS6BDF3_9NOCA|nr:cellulase family glycosylhydrolase [Nocardia albiluteola]MBU3067816.1 cellulase family glycosylhydrolase [Nocardia albiluteola]